MNKLCLLYAIIETSEEEMRITHFMIGLHFIYGGKKCLYGKAWNGQEQLCPDLK